MLPEALLEGRRAWRGHRWASRQPTEFSGENSVVSMPELRRTSRQLYPRYFVRILEPTDIERILVIARRAREGGSGRDHIDDLRCDVLNGRLRFHAVVVLASGRPTQEVRNAHPDSSGQRPQGRRYPVFCRR